MSIATISPSELNQRHKRGDKLNLIDVRTPVEFRSAHVSFARNVPLDQLDPKTEAESPRGSSAEPLYIVCQSGGRSQKACEKFAQAGYTHIVNVLGGTNACLQADLPIVRGKKSISLERQVRIAAGSLVLTGVALSLLVHPAFIGLSGFVGAGLVFAGITDTCGMGMLLARMPWNRCSAVGT
jgi:rhodanese-related sulfurtransferase